MTWKQKREKTEVFDRCSGSGLGTTKKIVYSEVKSYDTQRAIGITLGCTFLCSSLFYSPFWYETNVLLWSGLQGVKCKFVGLLIRLQINMVLSSDPCRALKSWPIICAMYDATKMYVSWVVCSCRLFSCWTGGVFHALIVVFTNTEPCWFP
jgi:hypothetical protein